MRAGTPPEGTGDPIEAIEPLVTRDGGTSLKTPARSGYTRLVNQGRIPGRRRCGGGAPPADTTPPRN